MTKIADERGRQSHREQRVPKPGAGAEELRNFLGVSSTAFAAALAGLTAHALKVQDTRKAERGVISMRRQTLVAVLLAGACTVPGRVDAQTTFGSSTNVTLNAASDSSTQDSPSWLFPVAKLDESLPGWL